METLAVPSHKILPSSELIHHMLLVALNLLLCDVVCLCEILEGRYYTLPISVLPITLVQSLINHKSS